MQAICELLRKWRVVFVFAAFVSLAGCASGGTERADAAEEVSDPIEPFNRYVFEVNKLLDEIMFKPLAWWYRIGVPDPVQTGVTNFLANLRSPWTAVNDLFQGEMDRFLTTVLRFLVNSTFGIAGLFDPASSWGLANHDEDAGQTLAVWGAGDGPYMVLPIFGPSNVRDTVGLILDSALDPVNWIARGPADAAWFPTARGGLSGLDSRTRNLDTIDQLQKGSVDFYATIRSVYKQRRDGEIRNGEPGSNYPALNVFPK